MSINFWCELNEINWQSKWLRSQSEMLMAVQEGCIALGLSYAKTTQPVRLIQEEGKKDK